MSTAYMSTNNTRNMTSCTMAPPVGRTRLALAGSRSRRGPDLVDVPTEGLEGAVDDRAAHPSDEIEHPRQVVEREQTSGSGLVDAQQMAQVAPRIAGNGAGRQRGVERIVGSGELGSLDVEAPGRREQSAVSCEARGQHA